MPHAYTKDQFVEQPAIGLFTALGWATVSAMEDKLGAGGMLTANGEQFVEWKLIQRNDKPHRISLAMKLRRTRDLLLPRLLSGQIDVEAMPS